MNARGGLSSYFGLFVEVVAQFGGGNAAVMVPQGDAAVQSASGASRPVIELQLVTSLGAGHFDNGPSPDDDDDDDVDDDVDVEEDDDVEPVELVVSVFVEEESHEASRTVVTRIS